MTTKRNWQLHRLGITQWKLRRPMVLQGDVVIKLPDYIRFLLVADPLPSINHPLVLDVVRSLAITQEQVYGVMPNQVLMLSNNSVICHCWWIGIEVKRYFTGITICTPPIAELALNFCAKRELWRLISDNFQPDND